MNRLSLLGLSLLAGCGHAVEPALQAVADPPVVVAANLVQAQPAPPAAGAEGFRFPSDKGGGYLAQLLRPSERIAGALSDTPSSPKVLTGPRGLENPSVPLSAGPADLPRRVLEPTAAMLRPRAVAEATPLGGYRDDPIGPTRTALATSMPVSLPSVDVNLAVAVPVLNPLLADRVPTTDPSAAASREAALAATPPVRLNPVPFTPENLPDPFANAQAVRLRQSPPENPQPRP